MLRVEQVAGSREGRNTTFHVWGTLEEGNLPLTRIDLGKVNLKLSSAVWVVQEKLGIYLWWDKDREYLLLPMESRNSIRLDTGGMKPPPGWEGTLYIETFNWSLPMKTFFLLMDFDR